MRSNAPARWSTTPIEAWAGSVAASNTARTIVEYQRRVPCSGSSRRTAAANRVQPQRRTTLRSPLLPTLWSTTVIAASQLLASSGCAAAVNAAGQAHSSRSATCWRAATGLDDQRGATGPEMPQPGPGRVGPFGQVAAQLCHQPGNDHRIGLVVLVTREVLTLPRPVDQQRLHAHQSHSQPRGDLVQHPPAVPGRFTGHHHRAEAGAAARESPHCTASCSCQAFTDTVRRASTCES